MGRQTIRHRALANMMCSSQFRILLLFIGSRQAFNAWMITTGSRYSSARSNKLLRRHGSSPTIIDSIATSSPASPRPPPLDEAVDALNSLAQTTLALLSGDEESARSLAGCASRKRELVQKTFEKYDVSGSGTLCLEEAQALFVDLARS